MAMTQTEPAIDCGGDGISSAKSLILEAPEATVCLEKEMEDLKLSNPSTRTETDTWSSSTRSTSPSKGTPSDTISVDVESVSGDGTTSRGDYPILANGYGNADFEMKKKMKSAVRCLLECMGEDVEREGLVDTPRRVTEALLFMTKGYYQSVEDVIGNAIFTSKAAGMVMVKDIDFSSTCEHHMLPFYGKAHIALIPDKRVLGLSKYARVVEMFAYRLQLQEQLTDDIANALYNYVKPKGVAVVIEATHMCMITRGVQKTSSKTVTSCSLGCLENDHYIRQELMHLLVK